MTARMKLYTGLLVLVVVMVGTGTWFMLKPSTVETFSMAVSPPPGNYLINSQNVSSEVLLKSIQVERSVSGKQYFSPAYPLKTVDAGKPILEIQGTIQNNHPQNKEIAMYAEGYDETGKQVAWTLDAAHINGQIGIHLENGETGNFSLHLNYAANITSLRVFANNYAVTPP